MAAVIEDGVIKGAGCVLWRRRPGNAAHPAPRHELPEPGDSYAARQDALRYGIELCLVHRPKYGDWSHPKGKLKPGETALAAALREVEEETGHRCRPGAPLPDQHYISNAGPKQVSWWAAEVLEGSFHPTREVDRIAWLAPLSSRNLLTMPRDRELVDALLEVLHLS